MSVVAIGMSSLMAFAAQLGSQASTAVRILRLMRHQVLKRERFFTQVPNGRASRGSLKQFLVCLRSRTILALMNDLLIQKPGTRRGLLGQRCQRIPAGRSRRVGNEIRNVAKNMQRHHLTRRGDQNRCGRKRWSLKTIAKLDTTTTN